tara:strand:- start:19095 stop:19724 length:630 start_codon:yes stop_codon:yes gene_type:complete
VIKKINLVFFFILLLSCWNNSLGPAVNSKYNFKEVGILEIDDINDHSSLSGSGEMVLSSLTYNFLKYGYNVNISDSENSTITLGAGSKVLLLSCVITEFSDSKMIVVPFRHEDKGYTKTVVTQSSKEDEEEKSEPSQSQTSTTTTHAGKVKEGERITYTQSRVGVILKMTVKNTGDLVWSNSYWYSGLEIQRTIESCVKTGVSQINKLF